MTSTRVKIRIFFNDNSEGTYFLPENLVGFQGPPTFEEWCQLLILSKPEFIYLTVGEPNPGPIMLNTSNIFAIRLEN